MRELTLAKRTEERLNATMINTPVYVGHATPPKSVVQYAILYPGSGRGSSDRLTNTPNTLDWACGVMSVGRTVNAALAVLGRVRDALLGYDLEPDNDATGLLYEPEGQDAAVNTYQDVEGDTRHSITLFYRLTTER